MTSLRKVIVFVGPVLLAAMMRTIILVVHGGPELEIYDRNPAKLFDVSIELLLGSTAILLGLLLYSQTSTLKKPGTNVTITANDIIACCVVQIFALTLTLFFSLAMPHFVPVEENLLTIWLPDLCGAVALVWSMFKLA